MKVVPEYPDLTDGKKKKKKVSMPAQPSSGVRPNTRTDS